MDEVRALSLTGMLGSGYLEASLERALSWDPTFIGCDAGSTDSGASALGTGRCSFSKTAVKRDVRLALLAALKKRIPLLIGSAGSAGADPNLNWAVEIATEIAREEGLHFQMAVIHAEQDRGYLKKRLAEGRVKPLKPVLPFDEALIDRSEHIVGMMGAEPFVKALEDGAQVVIAGRSSDTSIFAALPVHLGFPAGLAWHAAKILECGAAAVMQRAYPDCMFARIRRDHFVVEPPNPDYACSTQSVAAHTLYENASPFHFHEPSGMLDASKARYDAESDRAVRVSGSEFVPASVYTIKLEGAERAGYQTIVLGGVRDPVLIEQIDDWVGRLKEGMQKRVVQMFGEEGARGHAFNVRIYGKNGVMGKAEPRKDEVPHELLLVLEATAPTQEMATSIASSARHLGLHLAIPQWKGLISTMAFPYTPAHTERGPVYRFNVNHVVEPDDPYEMFPMEMMKL